MRACARAHAQSGALCILYQRENVLARSYLFFFCLPLSLLLHVRLYADLLSICVCMSTVYRSCSRSSAALPAHSRSSTSPLPGNPATRTANPARHAGEMGSRGVKQGKAAMENRDEGKSLSVRACVSVSVCVCVCMHAYPPVV